MFTNRPSHINAAVLFECLFQSYSSDVKLIILLVDVVIKYVPPRIKYTILGWMKYCIILFISIKSRTRRILKQEAAVAEIWVCHACLPLNVNTLCCSYNITAFIASGMCQLTVVVTREMTGVCIASLQLSLK